ncbi:MAG: glycosyltransferase [Blastocatellia bacterium]|nr:glycosyltransferase [Blastocatellia bacterium]
MVQLEAMACGLPVVNTGLDSGVPFVSLDGLTGLTVPPGDSVALSRALNKLLDDDELRGRLGDAARKRVDTEFTAPVMGRRMLDLYTSVVGRGESGRATSR